MSIIATNLVTLNLFQGPFHRVHGATGLSADLTERLRPSGAGLAPCRMAPGVRHDGP